MCHRYSHRKDKNKKKKKKKKGSGIAMSCGVGCRHGSDPELLWLWHRLADTAPIRLLAWEPPYAKGVALEKAKRQKKKKERKKERKRKVDQIWREVLP